MSRFPSVLTRACCLSGLFLLVCGCGVAEYEKKMEIAQDQLKRWEDETKLLDGPITVPQIPGKTGNLVPGPPLFFRPPRGIVDKPLPEPRSRLLYTYPPRPNSASGFASVELAFGDLNPDFTKEVLGAFPAAGGAVAREKKLQPPGRNQLTFQVYDFSDGQYTYSVYFWKGTDKQIAIAYWVAGQRNASTGRAIDLSLESFGADRDAGQQKAVFDRMRLGPLKPPDHPG